MTEKTGKNTGKKILASLVYALILVLCVLLLSRRGGFARTLPFLLILPPVATLFRNYKALTAAVLALCAFVCARADDLSLQHALLFALLSGLIAAVGMLVKRFLVTARVNREKRKISVIAAVALTIVGLSLHVAVFGQPFGYFAEKNFDARYLAETYAPAENPPRVGNTYYNPFAARYESKITFSDGETVKNALFYRDAEGISDGYRAYHEARVLKEKRDELMLRLAEKFPEYMFTVEGVSVETDAVIDEKSGVAELERNMVFSISFYTQFPNEETYEAVCDAMKNETDGKGTLIFERNELSISDENKGE